MTSAFENLVGPGKPLRAEPPDSKEFAGPQRMGLARLQDAQRQGLALESQFDLAYNATRGRPDHGWPTVGQQIGRFAAFDKPMNTTTDTLVQKLLVVGKR